MPGPTCSPGWGRTLAGMADPDVIDIDIDEVNRDLQNAPPPTPDDQSLLRDGRRLDSAEKVVAWYVEVGAMTPGEAEEFLANR